MIFLDISTINLEIAKLIFEKNIAVTIVTNMIDIMQLYRQNSTVRLIFLQKALNKLVSLCYNVLNKSPFIDKMTYSAYYINSDLIRNLIKLGRLARMCPFRRLKQSAKSLYVNGPSGDF